ncbi:fluoride efflux transporter FluC [Gracilibacillus massiliensis]|uniref:fluoride efflux transporter FluC n=1 Tax=Gracilibacillus massiliensis TaxID=1564956 RepID=UPI00071D5B4A|nr:CrcB family protein [Gracilibacillus massiliensis]
MNIALLMIGGSIGAVSRYLFGMSLKKRYKQPRFPVAMLVVNLLGSFGLGLFSVVLQYSFTYKSRKSSSNNLERYFFILFFVIF